MLLPEIEVWQRLQPGTCLTEAEACVKSAT